MFIPINGDGDHSINVNQIEQTAVTMMQKILFISINGNGDHSINVNQIEQTAVTDM